MTEHFFQFAAVRGVGGEESEQRFNGGGAFHTIAEQARSTPSRRRRVPHHRGGGAFHTISEEARSRPARGPRIFGKLEKKGGALGDFMDQVDGDADEEFGNQQEQETDEARLYEKEMEQAWGDYDAFQELR